MNHCIRLLLLFTPSLIALGLLGFAFSTNWWTISLEKNIPNEKSFNLSSDLVRVHSILVRLPILKGLLSECIVYRNVKVLVSTKHDFRPDFTREDKIKLANENCTADQFQCETGVAIVRPLTRCVDRQQYCNRVVDCEDKSDETSCTNNPQRDNQFFNCPTGYTKCRDGKSCYRENEQTCDGVNNCIDNSDEMNCNSEKCHKNKHVFCPDEGKCARRENSRRCDGIVDCADYSDEENCLNCDHDGSAIQCDSKCLPIKYRCDGIVHCSNFRDEADCGDYTTTAHTQKIVNYHDRKCMERRFNPFQIFPSILDSSLLESYTNPGKRVEHANLVFYLQLAVFYGVIAGLVFLLLSIISLFFFGCCRRHCISIPFYFYGFFMFLAWIVILTSLITFAFLWLWQKQTILDYEKSLPLDIMIHEHNPTLRNIEFFGLSYWLACGSALATFIGLLISYCVCCTVGSSRADDKEYEIMHMHSY